MANLGPRLGALGTTAVALMLFGCSVDPVDLTGKACPCAPGWTCLIATGRCVERTIPADADLGCCIYSDGKLYCGNAGGAQVHAAPAGASSVVNVLDTTYSWFDCWETGDLHAGGNTTWYHTLGDQTASWGWVAGVDLLTPDGFDADPAAMGLPRCAE